MPYRVQSSPGPSSVWTVLSRWSGRFDPRALAALVPLRSLAETSCQELCSAVPERLLASLEDPRVEAAEAPQVFLGDPGYPTGLLDLPCPPPVLWALGDLGLLGAAAAGIVGTRSATGYGLKLASRLARAVVEADATVVSGGARGIDTAAHRATLPGGRTVVVLGAGVNTLRGPVRGLVDDVLAAGGLVLSEMAPSDQAGPWTFPRRNRIIAGLSRVLAVVEAPEQSGALNTADQAMTIGREVLAVPGRLGDPASVGCLRLIEEGATVLRSPGDLAALVRPVASPGRLLLDHLARPRTLEDLAFVLARPVAEVARALSLLELTGAVKRLPGDHYVTCPPRIHRSAPLSGGGAAHEPPSPARPPR